MSAPQIPVTEDELHAYVDNELPAERRSDVGWFEVGRAKGGVVRVIGHVRRDSVEHGTCLDDDV